MSRSQCTVALILPLFALIGCDGPTTLADPDVQAYLDPNGEDEYSLYFKSLDVPFQGGDPRKELKIAVSQKIAVPCVDENTQNLLDPNDVKEWGSASGTGTFLVLSPGRAGGGLEVKKACWWDEWNPAGFPESAWAKGTAYVGGSTYDFYVNLISERFPALPGQPGFFPPQQQELDAARLIIEGLSIDEEFLGELHHESDALF